MSRLIELVRKYRRAITILLVALIAAFGFEALRLTIHDVHLSNVRRAIDDVSGARIVLALALTVLSYLALTLYDRTALKIIGRPQRWRVAALASFTSYTLSHNLGLSVLTGGSARFRVYRTAGLEIGDIVRVGAIASATFWAGVFAVTGIALLILPDSLTIGPLTLSTVACRLSGIMLLALTVTPVIATMLGKRRIAVLRWSMPVPAIRDQGVLAAMSLIDLIAAAAALFVLIPGAGAAAFPHFFCAYAIAVIAALITHVPGGLGVFEAVMLAVVPGDQGAIVAALLLYRIIYYLLPLLSAGGLVAVIEGRRLRRPTGTPIATGLSLFDRAARALAPSAVTLLVFTGGCVLLLSGALPGVKPRLDGLDDVLPLPLIEGSHLAASLFGTALLLIAPALNARMRSGFQAARLLLIGGAIFSLVKGLDYEEAVILCSIAALLQYCRAGFYRKGALVSEPINAFWIAAAAGALALSIWTGFFAYKRTPYSDELWWRFAIDGNAPRFLRASFAAGVLIAAVALSNLLSAGRRMRGTDTVPEEVVARAIEVTGRTDANLAFTGDKSFIVSAANDAFLMYRVQGSTWVVMGDPVGPRAAWSELVWAIRRASDQVRGRLCFYQASEAMLPLFVELGLGSIKYGEEAQIGLADFSLAGPRAKALRHGLRRAEAAGLTFEIIARAEVPDHLIALRAVSDAWLAGHKGHEKRFSLGAFDAQYIARFDCAAVRGPAGIVAFANIWPTARKQELSVDLMRHTPGAPYGTMDMLLVRLLEWGGAEGYARFNLGLAPLSGIKGDRLSPLWAKLGRTLYENGERFYSFAGLRAFKAKFKPEWHSRYIGSPTGVARARALIDLVRVVGL